MKQLQDSPFSSVEEKKSFDENSSQELSLESLSEISGGNLGQALMFWGLKTKTGANPDWGRKPLL